ncbi:DMT family transporter [Novosphingobium album (ex Liu et al. 2023)]|uniref:DMT family transporter n=1 Tax=Novosphingobium album (ex Liu et al. 2023) TaxID=3031130 RepID=A0ABT5WLK5_9SPHN|nr:DMT family transporter [Novosphingobium album (ex Liu et al. 2023)]MDE8650919.1 DMT family transporter [Novosphingobium album (ex Liu et al. 2023)]
MTADAPSLHRPGHDWTATHLAALLVANVALALGPWLVRLADTGPVAAGFWRLALAVPVLALLSLREPVAQRRPGGGILAMVVAAGVFFALDLASWHVGIETAKLGNASLFGNAGSVILMGWGLIAARRAPRVLEIAAIASALGGAALLMGGSLEISHASFVGDLFCLLAGLFYAFYILMLRPARVRLGQFSILLWSTLASVPFLMGIALLRGEVIMPTDWTPLLVLAMSSQVIGQGLLIYSLRHFPPLVIGLALMTQPAISAATGWLAFGETLSPADFVGMALLAAALVMARAGDKG